MEKEQIIKALEWCIQSESCEYCGYKDSVDVCSIRSDALALIKELTEKVEAYRQELGKVRVALNNANVDNKRLTEENERLTKQIEMSEATYQELQFAFSICANQVKADTVREFAERFKELMGGELASCGFCNAVGYWSVQTVKNCIYRIANEILNKNTEEEKK